MLDRVLQPHEWRGPERLVWANPALVDALQRYRIELVPALAAIAADRDQSGRHEYVEVFHSGVTRLRKRCREIAGGSRATSQLIEHAAAGRICQRAPDRFERVQRHERVKLR